MVRDSKIRLSIWLVSAASWMAAGLISISNADENVYLTGVPDYDWEFGCFGTATGNLMGYWDRHGLPDFYLGPTGGGLAPLDYALPSFYPALFASGGPPPPMRQLGKAEKMDLHAQRVGEYTINTCT